MWEICIRKNIVCFSDFDIFMLKLENVFFYDIFVCLEKKEMICDKILVIGKQLDLSSFFYNGGSTGNY